MAALIEDLHERGLDKRVLLIVTGEFGRTPKISYAASTGKGPPRPPAGVVQPGRDHWPHATSLLFSGGGIAEGQVIGATDSRGEDVVEHRVGRGDFWRPLSAPGHRTGEHRLSRLCRPPHTDRSGKRRNSGTHARSVGFLPAVVFQPAIAGSKQQIARPAFCRPQIKLRPIGSIRLQAQFTARAL